MAIKWYLDIGDFAKALEERAKLVLTNIARKASTEYSDVVWAIELIHRHKLVHSHRV